MIKSVFNYPVSTLLDIESTVVYAIPRYQREYTWGKWQWDALFEDLLENDLQYYLGSIICINQSQDALSIQQLELVDGQQRMTTLSLLLASIYASFKALDEELSMEKQIELYNLKHKLVLKKDVNKPRLIPQVQNYNQQDYFAVLNSSGILEEAELISNAGNRRVFKAYRHFISRITRYIETCEAPVVALSELLDKVNSATLVKIEVGSHSDAYTLFESLNNRGVPLTAIDLMKNKLLAKLEQDEPGNIERHFVNWTKVLDALGDDYAIQERYFRQYYNAFKPKLKNIVSVPVATKSNLIHIYEKLIANDASGFLKEMNTHANLYAQIIGNEDVANKPKITKLLKNLDHIQGAPSYLLLLLMFSKQQELALTDSHFEKVIELLISFFVRRNTTDTPATRDLTRIFMELSDDITRHKGDDVYQLICKSLIGVSASDEDFVKGLSGNLYDDNKAVCRFVLCAIEESVMTRESTINLWAIEGKQYVWTIEHIFPQGENIPQSWVDMIAIGNTELAQNHRQQYVHHLGNLTISGYNSTLGNKSFTDKRDRKNREGHAVGYKNSLYLNNDLAETDSWSIDKIKDRTDLLVSKVIELFKLTNV